jgi:hypothetical protein
MPKESDYQASLKRKILQMLPDAIVYKNGIGVPQGFPDLMILYKGKWAALEVKRSEKEAKHPRPNQPQWVERLNGMSFASFVFPENEKEVLDALYRSLKTPGTCGVRRE